MKNKLIEKIAKKLKDYPNLKAVVLYGSYARGEAAYDSDIDLLIVLNIKKPVYELKNILKIVRQVDKENKISLQLTNLKDGNYSFYQKVLREGKVLIGKFDAGINELKLQPYKVINYDLSSLKPAVKVKVSKRVNGSLTKKRVRGQVKEYKYKGLKDDKGVIVLPNSSVLLPEETANGFIQFLDINNVKYRQFNVWKE